MTRAEPVGELHAGFSAEGATPMPWAEASRRLEDADIAWLTTVRPDGRPVALESPRSMTGLRAALEGSSDCNPKDEDCIKMVDYEVAED